MKHAGGTVNPITPINSASLDDYLENPAKTIASSPLSANFQNIRVGLQDVAFEVAQAVEGFAATIIQQALDIGQSFE